MGWLYVPALEVSNSDCELQPKDATAWCAGSSGKPTPRPLSWRGWKNKPWIARLYGTILRPSTAARGAAWWIASLRESRVNPIASRGRGKGTRMNGRSGRNSSASLKNASQLEFSLRTSRLSSNTPSPSSAIWSAWVSSRHRLCFKPPRIKELLTSGNVSLSCLPTPTAQNYGTNQGGAAGRVGEVRPSLEILLTQLPTPAARDWHSDHGQKSDEEQYGMKGKPLPRVIVGLPTPLNSQRRARGSSSQGGEVLDEVVGYLPTPTAADYKQSGAAGYSTSSGRHSGTTLTDAILGAASAGRTGKLNPRLSEWMMGFPAGWMSSEPLAMPSFQIWLQRRGITSCNSWTQAATWDSTPQNQATAWGNADTSIPPQSHR